jgi:PPOX class probable F420-dependent enzyme
MKKMTRDGVYAFLNDHLLTAHVATVREDGRPHVAPVWIAVDGEDIVFTTWHATVKGKNIQRTGYAAISVDDSIPPFNSARAEGPVEVIDDLDELRHWATIIGGRYMGADRADEYGARNAVEGEMLCRMRPVQVSGIIGIAD